MASRSPLQPSWISVITENSEKPDLDSTMPIPHPLPPLNREFITHFGEMGSRWGINRTVGQIYALLYISQEPVNADEIAEALDFSRSNVSMGLKELQAWRLVRLRHLPSDRREYFEAPEDVWEIFRVLAEERRRREVEPTLSMLRSAMLQEPGSEAEKHAQARMREMHDLIDRLMTWFDDVQKLAPETAMQLMGMGSTVTKVLGIKDRLTGRSTRTPTLAKTPTKTSNRNN
jgi:DNA-binding transcriptional regulator GbsR (MarR family)